MSSAGTRLAATTSTSPTGDERELADIAVLRASASECQLVVNSVCKAARMWKDLPLWLRTVRACCADSSFKSLQVDNKGPPGIPGHVGVHELNKTIALGKEDGISRRDGNIEATRWEYGCDPMGIRRRVIIDGMMG